MNADADMEWSPIVQVVQGVASSLCPAGCSQQGALQQVGCCVLKTHVMHL